MHDTHVIAGIPNGEDQLVDYREQFPFIGKYLSSLGKLDAIVAPEEGFETQL